MNTYKILVFNSIINDFVSTFLKLLFLMFTVFITYFSRFRYLAFNVVKLFSCLLVPLFSFEWLHYKILKTLIH